MAIAGGAAVAYLVRLDGIDLKTAETTMPISRCISPKEAVASILRMKTAIVRDSDMDELRRLWNERVR